MNVNSETNHAAVSAGAPEHLLRVQHRQVLMVVECEEHAGQIVGALDQAATGDWIVLTGTQARRFGELVCGPTAHNREARLIIGIGNLNQISETLSLIGQAVGEDHACPNCAAYVWRADRIALHELPHVLLSHSQ
jgi:hypothetical protein